MSRFSQVASDFGNSPLARLARVLLIATISAAIVMGIQSVDSKRQLDNQTTLALRWSRQIVTQTESLALAADARGERDPLTWAARILSQGTDTRILYASEVQVPVPVTNPETYSLDPSSGIFDYTRIFDQQGGFGIHIRLYTSHIGIFGARSLFQQDLTVTSLFLLIYGLLFFWFGRVDGTNKNSDSESPFAPPAPPELNLLRPLIAEWVADAKRSLTDLGVHIREMVRAATRMNQGVRESKELLYSLRLKVQAQLDVLHSSSATRSSAPKGSGELTALATEVEALLDRKPAPDMATQALLKKLLAAAIRHAQGVADAQHRLEPIASDANLAFASLEEIIRATEDLSAEIRATTEGMVAQSRKMADLKKRSEG